MRTRKRVFAAGFTLTEVLVVAALVATLALFAVPFITNNSARGKGPGARQAAVEASIAVRSYQQMYAGNLPTTLAEVETAGYKPVSYANMSMCYNWSNGAPAPGKFMIRAYPLNSAGTRDTAAKQYIFDSGIDTAPREVTQAEAALKFCAGETGTTWPTGGTAYLAP